MSKLSRSLSSWWSSWQTQPPAKRRRHVSILVGSTLLIALIIVLILKNIIILPDGAFTTRTSQTATPLITPENITNPTTDPYLARATAILAHFNPEVKALTDSRGFYGDSQWCKLPNSPTSLDCETNLQDFFGQGDLVAGHRSTVQLIWARYHYYLATGDPQQFQFLLDDINNLVTNVLDSDVYVLQNGDLNCPLIQELTSSPYFDDNVKNQLARICVEAGPEVHPESIWEYTQYPQVPFFIEDFSGAAIADTARVIDDSMRVTYDSPSLQQTFNQMLQVLGNGGIIAPSEYSQRVSDIDKYDFLAREAIGALNYASSLNFTQNTPELYEQDLINYLLLTRETLEWVITNPTLMESPDSCLVNVNLRYYLETLAPDILTPSQLAAIFSRFPALNADSNPDCLIVADILLPSAQEEIRLAIIDHLNNVFSRSGIDQNDNIPGYFILSNNGNEGDPNGYIYYLVDNIYQAGLLSKYHQLKSNTL
jgi:hypothetical protein